MSMQPVCWLTGCSDQVQTVLFLHCLRPVPSLKCGLLSSLDNSIAFLSDCTSFLSGPMEYV